MKYEIHNLSDRRAISDEITLISTKCIIENNAYLITIVEYRTKTDGYFYDYTIKGILTDCKKGESVFGCVLDADDVEVKWRRQVVEGYIKRQPLQGM